MAAYIKISCHFVYFVILPIYLAFYVNFQYFCDIIYNIID